MRYRSRPKNLFRTVNILEQHNIGLFLKNNSYGKRIHYKFRFDIDGVVCEGHQLLNKNISIEDYNKMIADKKCRDIFIKTIKKLEDLQKEGFQISIGFITGRKPFSKHVTEKMFIEGGLEKYITTIEYLPLEMKWEFEDYHNFKRTILDNDYEEGNDRIYLFDDDIYLINKLSSIFKNHPSIEPYLIKN